MTTASTVHVTARPREAFPPYESGSREGFWALLRKYSDSHSNSSPAQLEGIFKAGFGGSLRAHLVSHLRDARDATEMRSPRDEPWLDFERYLFRGPGRDPERWDAAGYFDMVARISEARYRSIDSIPELRTLQSKIAAAGSVTFAVRRVTYGSLGFDLSLGSLDKLATIFENNFDSLQVSLEAFVPLAFADVLDSNFASALDFEIAPSAGLSAQFAVQHAPTVQPTVHPVGPGPAAGARDKAEWIWRLANGSLLVPLIISILVMWYGIKELSAISDRQLQYMQPLLQHQLELLREDRARLQPCAVTPSPPDSRKVAPN